MFNRLIRIKKLKDLKSKIITKEKENDVLKSLITNNNHEIGSIKKEVCDIVGHELVKKGEVFQCIYCNTLIDKKDVKSSDRTSGGKILSFKNRLKK